MLAFHPERFAAIAKEAGLTLQDTTLTAPISGIVLKRNIERGDLGMPGQPAFIIDQDEFEAAIELYGYSVEFQTKCWQAAEEARLLAEGWLDHK